MSDILEPIASPIWTPVLPTMVDPITLPTAGQSGYVQVGSQNGNPYWQDFLGDLLGVLPETINAVQGTTPGNIIYQGTQQGMDEKDYTPWLIAIVTIAIVGLIIWVTLKK